LRLGLGPCLGGLGFANRRQSREWISSDRTRRNAEEIEGAVPLDQNPATTGSIVALPPSLPPKVTKVYGQDGPWLWPLSGTKKVRDIYQQGEDRVDESVQIALTLTESEETCAYKLALAKGHLTVTLTLQDTVFPAFRSLLSGRYAPPSNKLHERNVSNHQFLRI